MMKIEEFAICYKGICALDSIEFIRELIECFLDLNLSDFNFSRLGFLILTLQIDTFKLGSDVHIRGLIEKTCGNKEIFNI